jgi:hypothetical protein
MLLCAQKEEEQGNVEREQMVRENRENKGIKETERQQGN